VSNPARKRDRRCVICRSNNAMLIEWCIGVHRPHKSLLIWQSHSIAGAARPPPLSFSLSLSFSHTHTHTLFFLFFLFSPERRSFDCSSSCRLLSVERIWNGRKTRTLPMTAGGCGRPRNCPSIFVSSRTRSRSPFCFHTFHRLTFFL